MNLRAGASQRSEPERIPRLGIAAAIGLAFVVLVSVSQHLRDPEVVLTGVSWSDSVARARAQCAAGGPVGRLDHEPVAWFFDLPCRYL